MPHHWNEFEKDIKVSPDLKIEVSKANKSFDETDGNHN